MGMIGNSLAQGLISGANIQDGTVDTPDIKDSAVTAAKIASAVITPGKLSTGAPTWDSSGNFLVGTASASYSVSGRGLIEVNGSSESLLAFKIGGGTTNAVYQYNNATNFETNVTGSRYCSWTVNGSERLRIDSSGNVGVGTTSPSARVHASGGAIRCDLGSAGTSLVVTGTGSNFQVDHSVSSYATLLNSGGGLAFSANGAERMRIDTSGRMGVGTTNPLTKVDIRGTSANAAATVQIVGTGVSTLLLGQNADGGVIRGQGGNNCITFWTGGAGDTAASGSGTERARIDASGNLTVNGYHVMRFRGGVAWGDVDSYTGSSYDGYYQVSFSGHSGWLFSQNSGGSAGTIQMYSTYFDGPWYRSKTDNSSWTSWRQL